MPPKKSSENDFLSHHIEEYDKVRGLLKIGRGAGIILGESGSGKTVLAMKQVIKTYWAQDNNGKIRIDNKGNKIPLFTEIIVCSCNPATSLRWKTFFKRTFNRDIEPITPDLLGEIYAAISARYTESLSERGFGPESLFILDDIAGRASSESLLVRNNQTLISLSADGRNVGCRTLVLAQDATLVPKSVFKGAKYKVTFKNEDFDEREDHIFPKILSGTTSALPHLKGLSPAHRRLYFHQEMDSLEAYQCIIVYRYKKKEEGKRDKDVSLIYKYIA